MVFTCSSCGSTLPNADAMQEASINGYPVSACTVECSSCGNVSTPDGYR